MDCLLALDGKDPLRCTGFTSLASCALEPSECTELLRSTKRRWLSYDHCVVVAQSNVQAVYIARGRPDMWQPETKVQHRRRLEGGVWACRQPADRSDEEFWASRRDIALVHGVSSDFVVAHFYADLQRAAQTAEVDINDDDDVNVAPTPLAATGSGESGMFEDDPTEVEAAGLVEGVARTSYRKLRVLNTHLGKAGGLNFGIEALLHLRMGVRPSPTSPMFFGIIDARHNCDARFWLHVLPSFFEVHVLEDRVMFNPDIALCQVPHSYIGMSAITDKLDVQNNFFFDGMALFRDRSNGMTSCGTGGIWSITSPENVGEYFFGRTMIEDTTSTHKYFLEGFYSTYIPPLHNSKQLMRAVPKIGANYVDALERWDTGAIQSLLTQGVPRCWFWVTLTLLLLLFAAIAAPAFTVGHNLLDVIRRPLDPDHILPAALLAYSAVVFIVLIITVSFLAACAPTTLNWCLRFLIMFFNVTYPFTSVFGLFWLAVPPFVAFTGSFPFSLNAPIAAIGSLILKFIEFGAIAKLQGASNLDEHSISMTQKMDKVAVPIKIRAIIRGFITGHRDRYHYHDNSFWISFGASVTLLWIRRWLLLLMTLMGATLLGAIIHLAVAAARGPHVLLEKAMPLAYAVFASLNYIWLLSEPFAYLMKGKGIFGVPPRWLEVGITLLMIAGIYGLLEATRVLHHGDV